MGLVVACDGGGPDGMLRDVGGDVGGELDAGVDARGPDPLPASEHLLAEGEAMLATGRGERLRTESIGVFVDGDGIPTHVYDLRWDELSEVVFTAGADRSNDVCASSGCDWFVDRWTGCVHIEYEAHFRPPLYDDTGDQWTGSMAACPTEEPYPHRLRARTESGAPWLLPGDAILIEANHPLSDEDAFEVRIDGEPAGPVSAVGAGVRRVEAPAAFDTLTVHHLGSRALPVELAMGPVPTSATIDDWTLATEPSADAYAGPNAGYSDGSIAGATDGWAMAPVYVLFALGAIDGAASLDVDLTTTYVPSARERTLQVVRADGTRGAKVDIAADVDAPIPVPDGAGDAWLQLVYDPVDHPHAAIFEYRLRGVSTR